MHAPYEGAGTFGEVLQDGGASLTTVKLYETTDAPLSESGFDLILSMGGPQDADDLAGHSWLARETEMLARAVQGGCKVLGICLGAQILARALGAELRKAQGYEIGFHPIRRTEQGGDDPILAGLKDSETVMHWHQDTFELPDGAVLLASSDATAQQAYRVGRHAYGLQFHLEVTPEHLAEWLENPGVRQQLLDAGGSPERLLEESQEHDRRLRWLCNSVLSRLVNLM
jgi:GMP synthase-like glutamine amidotransferase